MENCTIVYMRITITISNICQILFTDLIKISTKYENIFISFKQKIQFDCN